MADYQITLIKDDLNEERYVLKCAKYNCTDMFKLFVLQNPSRIDGDDPTVKLIFKKFNTNFYIINLYPFCDNDLFRVLNNLTETEFINSCTRNIPIVIKYLNRDDINEVIFAFGQHFKARKCLYKKTLMNTTHEIVNLMLNTVVYTKKYFAIRLTKHRKYPCYIREIQNNRLHELSKDKLKEYIFEFI
jgi:hypothetical protein